MQCPKCNRTLFKEITDGIACVNCGSWQPHEDIIPMARPNMRTIKKPMEQDKCIASVMENMPTIKALRLRGISYRSIAERLKLEMNHTTLQKHYSRITAGLPELKRGRKPAAREVAA